MRRRKNLAALSKQFPDASLTGLDLSMDVLEGAGRRLSGRGTRVASIRYIPYNENACANCFGTINNVLEIV